jgi:nitrogen fixation protein FixH
VEAPGAGTVQRATGAGGQLTRLRGLQWPLLVTAALLFTVGANVVMLFAASGDRNGSVVEPDYYRKAVDWDRTMARRAESARLGWLATAALGDLADARRTVEVTLTDSLGTAVGGAELTVTLIHNSDAAHPVVATLKSASAGEYHATVPALPRGRWEVRVEARHAAGRFGAILHVDAP